MGSCEYLSVSMNCAMAKCFPVIRKLFLILILVWLGGWGIASVAAPMIAKVVVQKIQVKAKSMGVEIDHIEYSRPKISPWFHKVSVQDVRVDFDLVSGDKHRLSSSFHCDKVQVNLEDLFKLRGRVLVLNFETIFHESDLPKDIPFGSFTEGNVMLSDISLLKPREAVQDLLKSLTTLFHDNVTTGKFVFSGKVQIKVNDKNVPARIYTESRGDEFRLRFSDEDIRVVAKEMKISLSDEQVAMVSYFPLRVPLIAMITSRARAISLRYYAGDHWKQDALRHTMWSFMLTEAFGPKFAHFATDAQESKPGNTHYERLMDYNNNAVGRAYVSEKVKLEQIPALLLKDPRIVLSPEAAEARGEARLLK